MIKNYYAILVAFNCFYPALSMQPIEPLTLALFDPDHAIVGTKLACSLVHNSTKPTTEQTSIHLHKESTYRVISDKKNQRVGIFTPGSFIVYDITTKEHIWSKIIHSKNCSAAFCPVDDTIFLYEKDHLTSNNGISMILPYVGRNTQVSIECHPRKKELLYPYSDKGLRIYCFTDQTDKQHFPKINKTDTILRAFYNTDGDQIALLTKNEQIFIYNPATDYTTSIQIGGSYTSFINPIFIPHTNIIVCLCKSCEQLHCWDLNKQTLIKTLGCRYAFSQKPNPFATTLDFSRDGTHYIYTESHEVRMEETPPKIIKYIKNRTLLLPYWLLKTYSHNNGDLLPTDIIGLLIQRLQTLYENLLKAA